VLFEFTGPSRSAALALNMLALICWQIALFVAVRSITRSDASGWLAALLPIALAGPWQHVPGSALDFRLDHLFLCAFGVTSAVALMTETFARRGPSLALGAVTGIALLTRFLSGTYFIVIFVGFAAWCLTRPARTTRIANLLLAAVLAAAIAGPIFWINRETVWEYYYVGHYVGPESAIRNQNFGLGRSVSYVLEWLGSRHLGLFFGIFVAAVAAVHLAARFALRTSETAPAAGHARSGAAARLIGTGLLFFAAPFVVLVLHPQKSDVVLSALVPGVVLLATGCWEWLKCDAGKPSAWLGLVSVAAATAFALGFFARQQQAPIDSPAERESAAAINTLADFIYRQSARFDHPIRVAVDHITDAMDAQVLRVICYERQHVWRDFDMRLPTGITEPDAELVRQRVAESDFVILVEDGFAGLYPYDHKLAQLRPELRAWCNAHRNLASRFNFSGHDVSVYSLSPVQTAHGAR
jgi:hypothetical protein